MSRHPGASGSLPSTSPNVSGSASASSPRPAAERRVLEQLAQQPPTSRRTLPRPASTSTAPVDPATAGRSRRSRSRRFSSNEVGAVVPQREPDRQELLTEILAEFPEIDATTVSVLLNMHNGVRAPVVQRLNEVYRRPGKEPQKRHSFPSSSPQERGRTKAMQSSASFKAGKPARKSRPFSIDRIDDSEDESVRLDVDDALQGVEPSATVNQFFTAQIVPEDAPLPSGRRSTDLSRSSHSPINHLSRVHTTSSLSSRTRPLRRTGGESSGGSGDSMPAHMEDVVLLGPSRGGGGGGGSAFFLSGSEGGGTRETTTTSSRASWLQTERDVGVSVGMGPGPSSEAHAVFSSVNVPQSVAVVAEPSSVALRRTPGAPPPSGAASRALSALDEDVGSLSSASAGTSSSRSTNVSGPTMTHSGVSSARSSVWSLGRSARSGAGSDEPAARESTARAAAGALMRGLSSGSGRSGAGGRTRDGTSRRRRAKRSVKELGQAVREKARQYREQYSEGECDDELQDADQSLDSIIGGGRGGGRDMSGLDSDDGGAGGDVVEPRSFGRSGASSTTNAVGVDEVMQMHGEQATGLVTISVMEMQRLVRKMTNAEQTIAEMQAQRKEKVAALMAAVNEVRASLGNFDKRQKQRFEDMSERFTGNNDSIERLSNDMWRIRRMLHEYETRRSRRFWRVCGMLLLDALAYVGLFVVWLCTSVYNVFVRQKRAITKLINSSSNTTGSTANITDGDEYGEHSSTPDDASLDGT